MSLNMMRLASVALGLVILVASSCTHQTRQLNEHSRTDSTQDAKQNTQNPVNTPQQQRISHQSCGSALDFNQPELPFKDTCSDSLRGWGSNDGCWTRDAAAQDWYIKAEGQRSELQSGAEMISSRIYRRLGYQVPDTALLAPEVKAPFWGRRRIASRRIPNGFAPASRFLANIPDTPKFRQLRYFAAYLKDWDRLGNSTNTLVNAQGLFWMIDFGGTLGSRARGEPKEDSPLNSPATGGIAEHQSGADILSSFDLSKLPSGHPWLLQSPEDRANAAFLLRTCLSDSFLETSVAGARYSNPADEAFMARALKQRRDQVALELESRH